MAKIDPAQFYFHLQNYSLYTSMQEILAAPEKYSQRSIQVAGENIGALHSFYHSSFHYMDSLPEDLDDDTLRDIARYGYLAALEARGEDAGTDEELRSAVEELMGAVARWREDHRLYQAGLLPGVDAEDADSELAAAEATRRRGSPRPLPKELFSVHSSSPVYDIGETIARGLFILPDGDRFPQADIIGKTKGRIELMPFWDHKNNRPLTAQSVNLVAGSDAAEFARMQEEALKIATSYNEEMATYFYAMDAYWLSNAKGPDEFIELQISDLMRFTGKKPVKTHGRYTGTFRRDQLQRAGMMVYGMGFSMVEIEKTIIKGVGERTHYRRLWDVSDIYVMTTLDREKYIETITYRPNEFFRSVSFGSRRETALLMAKVLGLDYDKMVVARRLGRYYTWLWRDRAHGGAVDAPIGCATLLQRAGVEAEKGKERYARRSLEMALDRLESEGIISQWILLDAAGTPVDTSQRISYSRWLEMKIAVTPPDVILSHYAAGIAAAEVVAEDSGLDVAALAAARSARKLTLAQLSEETGVELSTLSRIIAGKTKRPRAEHVKSLNAWLDKQGRGG